MQPIKYLVFDIESVADPQLVAKIHYPGEMIEPNEAVRKFQDELMKTNGSDFIPYTFQIPISIAIAKVSEELELVSLDVMGKPEHESHQICKFFWQGWSEKYKRPTLVSFNGRGFDVPMLELAAFRYGIPIPEWFGSEMKSFDQPRNRYNSKYHFDLLDVLTNYGATKFKGGLNLAASILGRPGKMDVQGNMVQCLYDAGEFLKINDYCLCDVLDTYFVFLRTKMLLGEISLDQEQELVYKSKLWLEQRAENPAFALYLKHWGDWENPWIESHCTQEQP